MHLKDLDARSNVTKILVYIFIRNIFTGNFLETFHLNKIFFWLKKKKKKTPEQRNLNKIITKLKCFVCYYNI